MDSTVQASGTRRGEQAEGQRSVRIPHAVESVPLVRSILHEDLTARHIDPVIIGEVETVASELVANAVKHAKALGDGCIRVRWKVKSGTVEVEVSDGGGPSTVRPVPPSPWANSGRGLRIVRSLAHEWGAQDDKNGRTVWAALGGPSRRRRL